MGKCLRNCLGRHFQCRRASTQFLPRLCRLRRVQHRPQVLPPRRLPPHQQARPLLRRYHRKWSLSCSPRT